MNSTEVFRDEKPSAMKHNYTQHDTIGSILAPPILHHYHHLKPSPVSLTHHQYHSQITSITHTSPLSLTHHHNHSHITTITHTSPPPQVTPALTVPSSVRLFSSWTVSRLSTTAGHKPLRLEPDVGKSHTLLYVCGISEVTWKSHDYNNGYTYVCTWYMYIVEWLLNNTKCTYVCTYAIITW